MDANFEFGVVVAQDIDAIDFDLTGGDIEILAAPCKFVGSLTVDFNR